MKYYIIKYKLKENVKIFLTILGLFIFEIMIINIYATKIDKINKGEITYVRENN